MKIVQVYKDYDPPIFGGIEHTVHLLAHGLTRSFGVRSSVLCSSRGPRTRIESDGAVEVVRAASFGRFARAPVSPGLSGWMHRLEPDLLHFHYPNPTGELACLLSPPRCPYVVTFHAETSRYPGLLQVYKLAVQRFLRGAQRIFVTSGAALENFPALRPHLKRCRVVPSGVAPERLRETERSREVTRELRSRHRGPIVLFVGRMRRYKGLPVLLDAMGEAPGTLILVGRGEMENYVRRRVSSNGLRERVVLAGDVSDADLAGYYGAADVFVLPSSHPAEAFGLVLVEAMQCGVPVISTRLGTGTSVVNQAGVTGLEVTPGDPVELADAIRTLVDRPELARRLGDAGRIRSQTFGASAMVERHAAVYSEFLPGLVPAPSRQPRLAPPLEVVAT